MVILVSFIVTAREIYGYGPQHELRTWATARITIMNPSTDYEHGLEYGLRTGNWAENLPLVQKLLVAEKVLNNCAGNLRGISGISSTFF